MTSTDRITELVTDLYGEHRKVMGCLPDESTRAQVGARFRADFGVPGLQRIDIEPFRGEVPGWLVSTYDRHQRRVFYPARSWVEREQGPAPVVPAAPQPPQRPAPHTHSVTDGTPAGDTDHERQSLTDVSGAPGHVYTRAQALADGTLVAADESVCRAAGIPCPVAYTAAVYAECVAWPDHGQDPLFGPHLHDRAGREWDLLWMLHCAMTRRDATNRATITLHHVPPGSRTGRPRRTPLTMLCGPGDTGEPVITVLYPGEG